ISLQYTTKIKMRVLPLLLNYYKLNNAVPVNMALGFAAFIRFMKIEQKSDGTYQGQINNREYTVTDSKADYFCGIWEKANIGLIVENVLSNKNLWDADLTALPGFKEAVTMKLNKIMTAGIKEVIPA
ncbi:MAG: tagaturonate reductase, partial [Candidatus Saccharimonadales bacterium]